MPQDSRNDSGYAVGWPEGIEVVTLGLEAAQTICTIHNYYTFCDAASLLVINTKTL